MWHCSFCTQASVSSASGRAEWGDDVGNGIWLRLMVGKEGADPLIEGNGLTLLTSTSWSRLWGRSCLSWAGHGSALASRTGAVLAPSIAGCSSGWARGAETQEPAPPCPMPLGCRYPIPWAGRADLGASSLVCLTPGFCLAPFPLPWCFGLSQPLAAVFCLSFDQVIGIC